MFDRFTKLEVRDSKFAEFLRTFQSYYRKKRRNKNGFLFDEIKQNSSTKDKQVIADKLDLLEKLMEEFLRAGKEGGLSGCVEEFIAQNNGMDLQAVKEDMDIYNEDLDGLLEKTVKLDSKLRNGENRPSLLAMVAYSYKKDLILDDWMKQYAAENHTCFADQKKNFLQMKKDFNQYCKEHKNSMP